MTREPNTTILTRIHASWPTVNVYQDDSGAYVADIPAGGNGTLSVRRRSLALLEDKIHDAMNAIEREQRRQAATPARTV
jgi:hypothetical protein